MHNIVTTYTFGNKSLHVSLAREFCLDTFNDLPICARKITIKQNILMMQLVVSLGKASGK